MNEFQYKLAAGAVIVAVFVAIFYTLLAPRWALTGTVIMVAAWVIGVVPAWFRVYYHRTRAGAGEGEEDR